MQEELSKRHGVDMTESSIPERPPLIAHYLYIQVSACRRRSSAVLTHYDLYILIRVPDHILDLQLQTKTYFFFNPFRWSTVRRVL